MVKFCIVKGVLIVALGNILALSSFASSDKVNAFSKENNPTNARLELEKSQISEKFGQHIRNLSNKNCWVFKDKYKSSIDNILTEISNSMLDISPYTKSARYSDGSKIAEFCKDENFRPISAYNRANWNYVVLMNLLQNMRNGDIWAIQAGDNERKTRLLNTVIMDIRNANIRGASLYDYDLTPYIEYLNQAANDIRQYFDSLDLWNFVLQIKHDYYKSTTSVQKNKSDFPTQITKNNLPHGIVNEAATCYLNATLQCLYNSAPIRTAITTLSQSPQKNRLAQQINNIFSQLATNGTNALNFNGAIRNIAGYIKMPGIGNQDPSEAVDKILDILIEEEIAQDLADINKKYSSSSDGSKRSEEAQKLRHHSTLGQICDIKYKNIILCNNCHNRAINDERITKLDLSIQNVCNKEILLHDLIESFEDEDSLKDANAYFCKECNRKVQASKRIGLSTLPKVLCLNIKRYYSNNRQQHYIGTEISCPGVIKIRQYKYKLRSFVYGGNLGGGHIIMAGYADDGTSYIANDDNVSISASLPTQKAQMLFYERID